MHFYNESFKKRGKPITQFDLQSRLALPMKTAKEVKEEAMAKSIRFEENEKQRGLYIKVYGNLVLAGEPL